MFQWFVLSLNHPDKFLFLHFPLFGYGEVGLETVHFFFDQDCGPQFPTDVSAVLKYGTNLIQVIGKFDGMNIIMHCHSKYLKMHILLSLLVCKM